MEGLFPKRNIFILIKMLMTPGPTEVPDRIRDAMARPIQNPDVDEEFAVFYHELEDKLKKVYGTEDDMLVLGGEGILGLETSIASLVEENDKVLCLSNGIYGDGFADFVEIYGGKPVMCKSSYRQKIDVEKMKSKLEKNNFKVATMVHCETPTGTLNDIGEILPLLKEKGIITVVDAVSSLGGTPVPTEDIDVCLCGSQKCFSAPPGLTTLSVSDSAWNVVESKEQKTFYTSLLPWKNMWMEDEFFPYTHLVSNLYALDEAVNILLEERLENIYDRHREMAQLCRERGKEMSLSLYPDEESICSPTVTAFDVEDSALEIQKKVNEKHDILLATSLGDLENRILRVGHMGYNAQEEKVRQTMDALEDVTSNFVL